MDDKKDYGFLTEDMYKVEFLQQAIQDFINSGVPEIDPLNPTDAEREVLIDYFHHFYALMEFQSILYTRLRLMKDDALFGVELAIVMMCEVLGMRSNESVIQFHLNMQQECKDLLSDLTGDNMDDYEGIDVEFKQ